MIIGLGELVTELSNVVGDIQIRFQNRIKVGPQNNHRTVTKQSIHHRILSKPYIVTRYKT